MGIVVLFGSYEVCCSSSPLFPSTYGLISVLAILTCKKVTDVYPQVHAFGAMLGPLLHERLSAEDSELADEWRYLLGEVLDPQVGCAGGSVSSHLSPSVCETCSVGGTAVHSAVT